MVLALREGEGREKYFGVVGMARKVFRESQVKIKGFRQILVNDSFLTDFRQFSPTHFLNFRDSTPESGIVIEVAVFSS